MRHHHLSHARMPLTSFSPLIATLARNLASTNFLRSLAISQERFGETRLKCGEDDDGYKASTTPPTAPPARHHGRASWPRVQVKLRLKHFLRYMATQSDDSPLYLFDADFGDSGAPLVPRDCSPPSLT